MSAMVRWSSGILLYATLQFAVLTSVAMRLFPDYRFADHFLSDLGARRTWEGRANESGAWLFALALGSLGVAMVIFAAAWRGYAFARQRARGVGIASQLSGTLSGLAFVGTALTPIDVALDLHNVLVVGAFALLLAFTTCTTVVWWRNGAPFGVTVAGGLHVALLVAYFGAVVWAVSTDLVAHRRVLIVGQKVAVYGSLGYVVWLTLSIRRRVTPAR
jgi:hypothetical membrane protein